MSEVVAEADGFREDFVEAEGFRDRPADLRDFEDVRQASAVVIAFRRQEDLGLVLETAKRLAMDDAIAVALIRRPQIVFGLIALTSACLGALCRARHERVVLDLLEHLADVHRRHSSE